MLYQVVVERDVRGTYPQSAADNQRRHPSLRTASLAGRFIGVTRPQVIDFGLGEEGEEAYGIYIAEDIRSDQMIFIKIGGLVRVSARFHIIIFHTGAGHEIMVELITHLRADIEHRVIAAEGESQRGADAQVSPGLFRLVVGGRLFRAVSRCDAIFAQMDVALVVGRHADGVVGDYLRRKGEGCDKEKKTDYFVHSVG